MPAYNSEKWIRSTIQSALAQTWSNKEIIIVDDGSKDNTSKIAKEYEAKNVKVITQVNSGASAARNKALSLAQGDFIQWLDADDLIGHDKLKIQLSNEDLMSQSKVLHSCAWGFFYYRPNKTKFIPNDLWHDLTPKEWVIKSFTNGIFIPSHAWLVSRELTDDAGLWDERLSYNDDGEYFCRVVLSSEKVKFHSEAKCYYRKGNLISISRSLDKSSKAIESFYLSINKCVNHLLNFENSHETRKVCVSYLNRYNHFFENSKNDFYLLNEKRILELGGSIIEPLFNKKFTLIKKIFGLKTAKYFKTKTWHLHILVDKYWDRLLSLLFPDSI
jgi:glycosyltransferase involved in cell wall biosynthesis